MVVLCILWKVEIFNLFFLIILMGKLQVSIQLERVVFFPELGRPKLLSSDFFRTQHDAACELVAHYLAVGVAADTREGIPGIFSSNYGY